MRSASSQRSPAAELFHHSSFNLHLFPFMAKASKKTFPATKPTSPTQQRLWLMYPPKLIKQPFIWKLGHKFKVVTNIRQASVTDEIGVVCLELDGKRSDVKAAIKWLEKVGV